MGEKTYMEILEGVLGKEEIDKTSIPLDLYMENWPENLVGKTCAVCRLTIHRYIIPLHPISCSSTYKIEHKCATGYV